MSECFPHFYCDTCSSVLWRREDRDLLLNPTMDEEFALRQIAASLPENVATAIAGRTGELTGIIEHLQSLNRRILNRLRPMALGHVPLPELLSELVSESAGSGWQRGY